MESLNDSNIRDAAWIKTSPQIFWGEIAPYEHVVQIYENDDAFLGLLADFVVEGVSTKECVIVIATKIHQEELEKRLAMAGYNPSKLISNGKLISINAEEALTKFMVNDWPDENLFNQVITELITKAKVNGPRIRAFGEMVAILWAKGQVGATVRLEHLWNKFCANEAFCLFCAYPQSGFTQDGSESIMHICSAHSKMINSAPGKGSKEIFYKSLKQKAM
jgi:hypothetical protein